jgi:hypothetical protein
VGGGAKRLRNEPGSRAKVHERRMAEIKNKPPELVVAMPKYGGQGEAEIVPGYELSPVLRKWVVEWLAERPLDYRPLGVTRGEQDLSNTFMGPIDWLAEKTGIHTRRVSGIVNGEFETVPLSQADALLSAIGRNDLLGYEINVWPNPNWSLEKWMAYMQEHGGCDCD